VILPIIVSQINAATHSEGHIRSITSGREHPPLDGTLNQAVAKPNRRRDVGDWQKQRSERDGRPAAGSRFASGKMVPAGFPTTSNRWPNPRLSGRACKELNERIAARTGISPDDLMIQLSDLPGENISFGQGLAQRDFVSKAT
jgi:hypothetical protein